MDSKFNYSLCARGGQVQHSCWNSQKFVQFRSRLFRSSRQFSRTLISLHVSDSEFQNPGDFCLWNTESGKCVIRNLGLWNPEYSLRNPKIPLKLAIQNAISTNKDRNKVSGIRNSTREIQDPRLFWLTLHVGTYWCHQQFSCSL